MSPVVVIRHPIFSDYVGLLENVVITYLDDGITIDDFSFERNLKNALRGSRLDFIDALNVELYASFDRSIVSIVTNHPSVDDLSRNIPFFKALAKFLYEGGLSKHREYDFAIVNALEIKDVSLDFQLAEFHPNRNFFLAILKDAETGYLYEDIIIRETEEMALV